MTTTKKALLAAYGEWGTLYRRYLIDHNKEKYYMLLSAGEFYDYIAEINIEAERLYEETLSSIRNSDSRTRNKQKEPAEQAREVVFRKLIFQDNAN